MLLNKSSGKISKINDGEITTLSDKDTATMSPAKRTRNRAVKSKSVTSKSERTNSSEDATKKIEPVAKKRKINDKETDKPVIQPKICKNVENKTKKSVTRSKNSNNVENKRNKSVTRSKNSKNVENKAQRSVPRSKKTKNVENKTKKAVSRPKRLKKDLEETKKAPSGPKTAKKTKDETIDNEERKKSKKAPEKKFICEVCDKGFKLNSILVAHKRIHTGEKPFKCEQCEKAFTQLGTLIVHRRIHTGEKPFKCEKCDKGFDQSSAYKYHLFIHASEKKIKCPICDMMFKTPAGLYNHKQKHRPDANELKYDCKMCEKKFASRRKWTIHKYQHLKPFHCQQCTLKFATRPRLNKHAKPQVEKIQNGKLKCGCCDASFQTTRGLSCHRQVHVETYKFICNYCGWRMKTAWKADDHVILHHLSKLKLRTCGGRSSLLEPNALWENFGLSRKTSEATRELKRPSCEVCDTSLPNLSALDWHNQSHHANYPFKCLRCGWRFSEQKYLDEHKDKVSGKVCDILVEPRRNKKVEKEKCQDTQTSDKINEENPDDPPTSDKIHEENPDDPPTSHKINEENPDDPPTSHKINEENLDDSPTSDKITEKNSSSTGNTENVPIKADPKYQIKRNVTLEIFNEVAEPKDRLMRSLVESRPVRTGNASMSNNDIGHAPTQNNPLNDDLVNKPTRNDGSVNVQIKNNRLTKDSGNEPTRNQLNHASSNVQIPNNPLNNCSGSRPKITDHFKGTVRNLLLNYGSRNKQLNAGSGNGLIRNRVLGETVVERLNPLEKTSKGPAQQQLVISNVISLAVNDKIKNTSPIEQYNDDPEMRQTSNDQDTIVYEKKDLRERKTPVYYQDKLSDFESEIEGDDSDSDWDGDDTSSSDSSTGSVDVYNRRLKAIRRISALTCTQTKIDTQTGKNNSICDGSLETTGHVANSSNVNWSPMIGEPNRDPTFPVTNDVNASPMSSTATKPNKEQIFPNESNQNPSGHINYVTREPNKELLAPMSRIVTEEELLGTTVRMPTKQDLDESESKSEIRNILISQGCKPIRLYRPQLDIKREINVKEEPQ